jgi:hypothetical protein
MYGMDGYSGKDRTPATTDVTAAHAIVEQLTEQMEEHGHKLYMDSFFSLPDLTNDLTKKRMHCCRTVIANRKSMPQT